MFFLINFFNSKMNTTTSVILLNEINQLKQIVNNPEDYISKHFNNIVNVIEIETEKAMKNFNDNSMSKSFLETASLDILERLNELESECLQNLSFFKLDSKNFTEELTNN